MSERQTTAGNEEHQLTVSLFHSFSHSLSLTHWLTHSLLTCWTTFVFMSMLKSHSHTLTLSVSHSFTLNMLNNFCFQVYAQKSLSLSFSLFLTLTLFQSIIHSLSKWWTTFVFKSMLKSRCLKLKIAMIFSWEPALWTLMSGDRVMMRMSKKLIAIFGYKQWLLSIYMKTKIVQHVSRINLSHFRFWI